MFHLQSVWGMQFACVCIRVTFGRAEPKAPHLGHVKRVTDKQLKCFSKPLGELGSGWALLGGGASMWSTPCSMGPAVCVQTLRVGLST